MRLRLLPVICVIAMVGSVLSMNGRADAGTCGSPVSAYFYYGVPLAQAPNGRIVVPVKADVGADACGTGAPVDGFLVPPGTQFVVADLRIHVEVAPQYCMQGLGLSVCGASRRIAGPSAGVTYAQTEVHPLDPTATLSGTFDVTFLGYGSQGYRTIG